MKIVWRIAGAILELLRLHFWVYSITVQYSCCQLDWSILRTVTDSSTQSASFISGSSTSFWRGLQTCARIIYAAATSAGAHIFNYSFLIHNSRAAQNVSSWKRVVFVNLGVVRADVVRIRQIERKGREFRNYASRLTDGRPSTGKCIRLSRKSRTMAKRWASLRGCCFR